MLPSRLDGDAQLGVYHLLRLSRCLENLYKVQQIIHNAPRWQKLTVSLLEAAKLCINMLFTCLLEE